MTNKNTNDQIIESKAQRLLDFLSRRRDSLSPLLILTHDYPDPDALAAAMSLAYLAQQYFDITPSITYGGVIGRNENKAMVRILKIPLHKIRPEYFKKYRNIALVDTQPEFKNNSFPEKRKATIVLDQHASTVKPSSELAIVDPECGATCVIVAKAILMQGDPIPARIATALVYGVLSDTLGLYRVHRADVIQTYLSIISHCDLRLLAQIQNPTRSRRFFLTLHRALSRSIFYRRLLVSHLGFVENPDLVSQMADFLLTYEKVQWSFCTGRYRGRLYVSLRTSKTNVQASEVLRAVFDNPRNAGGHDAIAGGSLKVAAYPSEELWQKTEQDLQFRLFRKLRRSVKAKLQRPFQTISPPPLMPTPEASKTEGPNRTST
ncbi:MAG: DHH family phosphoesterase [Acidobacteriota bacterium]|jgi:nanoRNase/pAp phosphatase (c-di-AMP/oligoRNAs hydrolase)